MLCISGIRFSFSNASSVDVFSLWIPVLTDALDQRSSKFVRTSYAAGPSILECKSCHGSLGHPSVAPYKINNNKNEKICIVRL